MQRFYYLLSLTCIVACSSPATTPGPSERPASATHGIQPNHEKLDYLSVLSRGHGIGEGEWASWVASGRLTSSILDELVGAPSLANNVAPLLLFKNYFLRPAYLGFTGRDFLRAGTTPQGDEYFYLTKECNAKALVEVSPWWEPATSVQVCGGDIAPAVWESHVDDGRFLRCSARSASPRLRGTGCRCGPNLVRCLPPKRPEITATDSLRGELAATVSVNVLQNRPLSEIFTSESTARDRAVELVYVRSNVEGSKTAEPRSLFERAVGWPMNAPKYAPRDEIQEGQHAGVLTSPHLLYQIGDLRQRMRIFFEVMWCAEVSAPGALPEHVLSLRSADLFAASDELASRPICTNCHARLDSAMRFFHGFPALALGSRHFVPSEKANLEGELYGNNIRDPRGKARLTPQGFAELATQQPEFGRCMARNATEYVFGPTASPTLIDEIASRHRAADVSFRDLLRDAFEAFLACEACTPPGGHASSVSLATTEPLAALVEEHCTLCHSDGAKIPSYEGELHPELAVTILDQVLSGRMPPQQPLSLPDRARFLSATAKVAPAVGAASDFLLEHTDPMPALPFFAARDRIHDLAGSAVPRTAINALENALDGRDNIFGPNFSTLTAVEAARACSQGNDKSSLQECLDRVFKGLWNVETSAR